MKATRILLFLSPLLWFVPPLIPMDQAPLGLAIANSLYRGLLGHFPGNALMAYLCYSYANQLGRESWYWVILSLRIPYLAPFILAFVPPRSGSAAEAQQIAAGRPVKTQAAKGPFEARFPLLAAYLPNQPEATRTEARARMEPVAANFEFCVFLGPARMDAFAAGAAARSFTLWSNPELGGARVFGAGFVPAKGLPEITNWLLAAAPEKKIATAVHRADGPTKFVEYYPDPN